MATYTTNYHNAVHFLHNNLIRINEIGYVDESIYNNQRFDNDDENGNAREIFQYYLTDCSDSDVEFLEKHFPSLLFTYSEMLDKYVLCVDHWGTGWDYVLLETDLEYFKGKDAHTII